MSAIVALLIQSSYFYFYGLDLLYLDTTGLDTISTYVVYGFQAWAAALLLNAVYDSLILLYDPSNAIGQYF